MEEIYQKQFKMEVVGMGVYFYYVVFRLYSLQCSVEGGVYDVW